MAHLSGTRDKRRGTDTGRGGAGDAGRGIIISGGGAWK